MPKKDAFIKALQERRKHWMLPGDRPIEWSAQADEVTLRLTVRDADKYGYLLEEIEVAGDKKVAEKEVRALVGRISYLTERMQLVEWSEANGGIARSARGEMDEDAREYFELLVRQPCRMQLRRYAYGPHRKRVAYHVTERQVARLIGDLTQLFEETIVHVMDES